MNKLILFDVDGTLIDSPRTDRFAQAINNIHDLGTRIEKDYRGFTDQLILIALLEDEGWDEEQIRTALPELVRELDRVHKHSFKKEKTKLLPGVRELLEALQEREVKLGLVTGNLKTIAKRKLEAANIWPYFSIGGFGNDPHLNRAELIDIAVKRAGFQEREKDIYVVGDTPRDIWAAKEAGIDNSVGVANGYRSTQELVDAGAKIVLENFTNTSEVISKLDLN